MTNRSMERRLADAVNKTAPQNADGVLSRCQERKGTITVMTEKRLARRWMGLAAACLAVILLGGGGWLYREEHTAVSVVSLDVNPSIELKVNRKERVLSCTPMNGDAEEVLADMGNGEDLKGAKLEVAVNAIVGGFVRKGYLDKISSALMISVEDRNQTRANKLQRELTETVDGILQSRELRVAVLTQTVPQDTALEKQAQEYHISTGKAALIRRILELNSNLDFAGLAELSIGELKDLFKTGAPGMPIGTERAGAIALEEYRKATSDSLRRCEVDAELDDRPAHYQVEIVSQSGEEFEYVVDAYTGQILKTEREPADDDDLQTTQPERPAADIGYSGAKAAALRHAGIAEEAAFDWEIEPDEEDGRWVYEVEFKAGGMEYEYVVDAADGTVLDFEAEYDD